MALNMLAQDVVGVGLVVRIIECLVGLAVVQVAAFNQIIIREQPV